MRAVRKPALTVLRFVILTGVLAYACLSLWNRNVTPDVREKPVDVVFFRTQNDADCILIRQGTTAIMIDTGEAVDAPAITASLEQYGIERIDLLILTHPDADHIGGAPAVIGAVEVGRVVMPQYHKEHDRLAQLSALLEERKIPVTLPTRTRRYTAGEMQVLVYPPLESRYNKDNNYSLATLVTHKDVSMIFTGDAEEKRLGELMNVRWPEADLLKIPRHGRASASSGDFIRTLSPSFAVSTSRDSDEEIRLACAEAGAELFHTGQGDVVFTSDGRTLSPIPPGQEELS